MIANFLFGLNIKSITIALLSIVQHTFQKLLTLTIPLWVIFFIVVASISIAAIINRIRKHQAENRLPDWYQFTQMEYGGRIFKWEYRRGIPDNLSEICPNCGCKVIDIRCPNCGKPYKVISNTVFFDLSSKKDLMNVIQHKIDTEEYKWHIKEEAGRFHGSPYT